MTISIATIDRCRYPPELLPDAVFTDITANTEASPPILDLRRFPGRLLRLSEIAVKRDPEVELRIKNDETGLLSAYNLAGGLFDLASTVSPRANNFQMLAKDRLYYNLFATADKEAFRTSFGVWVEKLTVAQKLALGIPLTNDEKALDAELGVSNTVEKGLLPLPLEQQIQREYFSQLVSMETHGRTIAASAGVTQTVETIYPKVGQFLVLTNIAATPGTDANNIRISISRDEDVNYIENLKAYSIGLDRELKMFIPALSELTLNIITPVETQIRYTILKVRLSNLLRARWGLELPPEREETIRKVKAGIL